MLPSIWLGGGRTWWLASRSCLEVHLRATRFHLRHFVASADRTADSLHGYGGEGWAHFEFTRIDIEPIILRKKIEDVREVGAFKSMSSNASSIVADLHSSPVMRGFNELYIVK